MKFRVTYQQREVRSFSLEAENAKDALEKALSLQDNDRMEAGEFDSADEQEILGITDQDGKYHEVRDSKYAEDAE